MIFTLEGLDCCGKSLVAKYISNKLNIVNYDLSKIVEDVTKISGNITFKNDFYFYCTFFNRYIYKCFDNFVKTRYHLSEYVYQQIYNRKMSLDFFELEACGKEKNLLIFIDIEYNNYYVLSKKFRKNEQVFSKDFFNKQKKLFLEAFEKSKLKKYLIYNNSDINILYNTIDNILVDVGEL